MTPNYMADYEEKRLQEEELVWRRAFALQEGYAEGFAEGYVKGLAETFAKRFSLDFDVVYEALRTQLAAVQLKPAPDETREGMRRPYEGLLRLVLLKFMTIEEVAEIIGADVDECKMLLCLK